MGEVKTRDMSEDLAEIVRQIVTCFCPRKVILFGSHAEGVPTAHSDIDLLVVARKPPAWREAYRLRSEFQSQFSLRLHLLFMQEVEFEETKDVVGGLAYPASRGGKVLYEQNP